MCGALVSHSSCLAVVEAVLAVLEKDGIVELVELGVNYSVLLLRKDARGSASGQLRVVIRSPEGHGLVTNGSLSPPSMLTSDDQHIVLGRV